MVTQHLGIGGEAIDENSTYEWEVHLKGGPSSQYWEIAVVRSGNELGKCQFGNFNAHKVLISHNTKQEYTPVSPVVWDKLSALAYDVAECLNEGGTV